MMIGEKSAELHWRSIAELRAEDLPIPCDVQVDDGWPPTLAEMADHIGPYAALCLCEAFGGRTIQIPRRAEMSPFKGIIDAEQCETMAFVYGVEKVTIPLGTQTILRAKRRGVIAAIRAGNLSVSAAARILRMRRSHLSRVVHHTDEGLDCEPIQFPEPRMLVALRRAAEIASTALAAIGAAPETLAATAERILDIWLKPIHQPNGGHHVEPQE